MKNSTRSLLIGLGILAGLAVVVTIWARLVSVGLEVARLGPPGPQIERGYDVSGFDAVSIGGAWRVSVDQGPYAVQLTVPQNYLEHINVSVVGSTLEIDLDGVQLGNPILEARIALPDLKRLRLSGATEVTIGELTSDELQIDISGAAELVGTGGRLGRLQLEVSGAARVDLAAVAVTDARLDLSGASQVQLNMAGGELTGDASGASSVIYSGRVRRVDLSTSGASQVQKR